MFTRGVVLVLALTSFSSAAMATTHEEEVVRSTYATVSFLCSLEPVSDAEVGRKEATLPLLNKEISEATPVFEISGIETGTIASIAAQNWTTRFSFPDKDTPVVLAGNSSYQGYTDAGVPGGTWRMMRVHWDLDNSFTPERLAIMHRYTVGKVVKMGSTGSDSWTTPAAYSRYATFEVTVTFQGRTVGPYTASFFFGKDAKGNEVVAPQDGIVSGQLLWEALPRQSAYPTDLIRIQKLRQNPVVDSWIQSNASEMCSSVRSDLCCLEGRCALPRAAVARDLVAVEPKRQ